jgi:hypothetical protein
MVPRLEGLPCKHMLAVYITATDKGDFTPQDFVRTFARLIPPFYLVANHAKGYSNPVLKPILTYLLSDATLPPCSALRTEKGKIAQMRKKGRSEGGFGKKIDPCKDLKQTKQNTDIDNLEAALELEGAKPSRTLRDSAKQLGNLLFGLFDT